MWLYKGNEIIDHTDLDPRCTDFVYMITYTNGKVYIGKKAIRAIRKKPPLKGKKRARRVMTNLPFADYEGSSKLDFTRLVVEKKEILYQCKNRKASTYLESAMLFHHDALFDPNYLNSNIMGKFYPNDLDGLIDD